MKRLCFFTLFLTSCAVGPDYVRPTVVVPAQYKEADRDWKMATPQDDKNRGPWWEVFNDPILNSLVAQVKLANQNVVAAKAQHDQALALVSQARAAYFPTVGASSSITRQKTSLSPTQSKAGTSNPPNSLYALGLNATWEPDLWGNVSSSVEAGEAGADASAANLENILLSMQGSIIQTYFQLRALDALQKLFDEEVDLYQKLLTYTQNRYHNGVAAKLDVLQVQNQLQTAQAQATDNRINRAIYEHAIAVLIGKAPSDFSLPPAVCTLTPPLVPIQLPSLLLERRPDIAQAERLMAQANAEIGVATAAYFPILSLSATGGFDSYSFAKWLTPPALLWSLGPALASTIFDGGLRAAKIDAARATYEQTVAMYRQTVLSAFQDVEDNLATLRILKDEERYQREAADSANKSLTIVKNQYNQGIGATADVLNAMINLYIAEKNTITTSGRQMVAAVGLIKALGGGWKG